MIKVNLKGRLGNVLFQYAVGRHLALKNGTDLLLIFDHYKKRGNHNSSQIRSLLSNFNIDPAYYKKSGLNTVLSKIEKYWPFGEKNRYFENGGHFCPEVLMLPGNTMLDGFFQSEKYFKEIESIIRNDFQIKNNSYGKQAEDLKEQVLTKNSVSLHIRRGDYLKNKKYNLCTNKYFKDSVEYMKENLKSPHFFIFSDDIEWCIKNMKIPDSSFVKTETGMDNPVFDLKLMSLCKHNIICNSSFSWWGAWLNENKEKKVVAPEWWVNTNKKDSSIMNDRLPSDWVRMNI